MPASTRTCIGCRQRGPAGEMVRLALDAEARQLRLGRGPGRGASLHRRATCVEGALRPGVLARAFKQPVDMSSGTAELLRQLTAVSRNQGTS
ncbi:MAG TPA: YlxR family protein [Polyangia bacterium]